MIGIYIVSLIIILIIVAIYLGIKIVPENEVWIFERLGEFNRALGPGINFTVPFLDRHKVIVKEIKKKDKTGKIEEIKRYRKKAIVPIEKDINIDIDPIEMITKDNANILVDTIIFIRIPRTPGSTDRGGIYSNAVKAIYEVDDYEEGVVEATLTQLRSIIGNQTLNDILDNRIHVDGEDVKIEEVIKSYVQKYVGSWGITVKTFDIQKLEPGEKMREAMEKQAAAEREKAAIEMKAEAEKQANILAAEAKKKAAILEAEGVQQAAALEAEAQIALAKASAESMKMIAESMKDGKDMPAMYLLGERYIKALHGLSASENSKFVVYPADLQATVRGLTGNMFAGSTMGAMMGMGMEEGMQNTPPKANLSNDEKAVEQKSAEVKKDIEVEVKEEPKSENKAKPSDNINPPTLE